MTVRLLLSRLTQSSTAASAAFALMACASGAPSSGAAGTATPAAVGASSPAISADDLRQRLLVYAADSMGGRLTGTEGNLKATAYIAAQLAALGLQPAGENGTFFQAIPLARRVFDAAASTASIDGQALTPWTDFIPRDAGPNSPPARNAPVVYGGVASDSARLLPGDQAAGKIVVLAVGRGADGQPQWSVPRASMVQRYSRAAAIGLVNMHVLPGVLVANFKNPGPAFGVVEIPSQPAYFHIPPAVAQRLFGQPVENLQVGATGKPMTIDVRFKTEPAPARNVVAVLPGSDAALRNQYVAIGAHNDHVGTAGIGFDHDSVRAFMTVVRPNGADSPPRAPTEAEVARIQAIRDSLRRIRPSKRDSIFNGADDDGSGSVGLLEIAEAFARSSEKPTRSILFVWHTGEELGLWGAAHFTDHPTVPRDSIVAQLNIDMIGRGGEKDIQNGGPGYLQLIGSRRLSTELGNLVEAVNTERKAGFTFDYQFDADGHPSNFYCRSDHYMYARYGIPIVFLTTGSHMDYHQITDEPQYIDYEKLRRVSQFVHDIAVRIANLDHRLVVDKPKPNPQGACQQ